MTPEIVHQVSEVTEKYQGLTTLIDREDKVLLSGILVFEASVNGLPSITESFEIEVAIPVDYPTHLPSVRETACKLDPAYEHLYTNGTFCLAVPVEEHRVFKQAPTLLGFIENLVIPYLYSYCHRKLYGTYPFGDRAHGSLGIVEFYREKFGTDDDFVVLAFVAHLYEHGYRGHHTCPCGSGKAVRQCRHARMLRDLRESHSNDTLYLDMNAAMDVCAAIIKADETQRARLTPPLQKQIARILNGRPRPAPGPLS